MSVRVPVAIATENNLVDGRILAELVRMVGGPQIDPWREQWVQGGGWTHVVKCIFNYLTFAAEAGVRHALLSIDNDGRPEHRSDELPPQRGGWDECCAECLLRSEIPAAWGHDTRRQCIVVPVQTLETWLLVACGHAFPNPERPESFTHRRVLKRLFWKDQLGAPEGDRLALGLDALRTPGGVDRLRLRESFRSFESQLSGWP